jgi:hypothetical protein
MIGDCNSASPYIQGGVADVEGASKVEGCVDEGASEGVAVMDGSIRHWTTCE